MTRRKRLLCAFLALIMCIGILPITSMASDFEDGLDHFAKTAAFTESIFSDVQKEDWFYDNVKSVYEYELMRGKGENRFDPSNSVTLAETITIAARIHAQYYIGMDVFNNSDPWYQAYVDYAVDCGIISDLPDEDYDAPATRGAFAAIISKALPDSAFEEINIVAYNGIPDVALSDPYGRAVYKLYRAGIMVGNDENGTFAPDSNIKRCEVAAIVTRMVEPALRQSVRLGEEYTVSFDLGYQGMTLDAQKVVAGYTAAEPKAPTRQNYIFEGWYTAANGGVRFEFDTEIHADMTLFAHWKVDPVWWAWIMDEFFDKDKEKPDEPEKPDKPDEPREEYDYGKLPYRPGKTWEELVEINGGEEPYIEMNDNDQVGLYIGRISDNRVEDVYDVIAELNNVRELLNINDARFEFVPSYDDGRIDDQSYRVQQVYNGVQVWCAQIVVIVDDDGYINGFISDYVDYVRYSGIEIDFFISEDRAIEIALNNMDLDNGVETFTRAMPVIDPSVGLVWYVVVSNANNVRWFWINTHNGNIVVNNQIVDQTDTLKFNESNATDVTYSFADDNDNTLTVNILSVIEGWGPWKKTIYYMCDRTVVPAGLRIHNMNGISIDEDNWNKDTNGKTVTYPGVIFSSDENNWDITDAAERLGLYGLYNFHQVMSCYQNIGFNFEEFPIEVNVNMLLDNAAYSHLNKTSTAVEFDFGNTDTHQRSRQVDTVGHEYTHFVQDFYIDAVSDSAWYSQSLGAGYPTQNSSSIDWVESQAISEGTADIMGMLIEAKLEGISLKSKEGDFWKYGENEQNANEVRNHSSENEEGNQTVDEMKTYYDEHFMIRFTKKHKTKYKAETYIFNIGDELAFSFKELEEFGIPSDVYTIISQDIPYGYGPGHRDGYIVVGILRNLIEHTKLSIDQLLELWFKSIKKLDSKSNFNDLRNALILSSKEENLGESISYTIANACDSVGIVGREKRSDYNIWFYKGLEKALKIKIITWDDLNNDKIDVPVTRRKYIDLLASTYEKLSRTDVESNAVSWAKGLHVIGDEWSGDYLDESIPKWQAALLMYQIFNRYHAGFKNAGYYPIYTYPYGEKDSNGAGTDFYYIFTRYGFEDFGESIPETINLNEMMQYYPGKDSIIAFQQQYMFSQIESINYITGDKDDTNTRNSLYYMGFYQLWRNGMFKGYSSSGKLRLGATDSISLGEACALITQVIPD